jgi:hypothetical protein
MTIRFMVSEYLVFVDLEQSQQEKQHVETWSSRGFEALKNGIKHQETKIEEIQAWRWNRKSRMF